MRFALTLLLVLSVAPSYSSPAKDYLAYVVCESADTVVRVRFGPDGASVDGEVETGIMLVDIDGPHGIDVSPDGEFYYVSLAHGRPYGSLWKYRTADDSVVSRISLGLFPATLKVTPDGAFAFVVNFNLHGDPVASSVSVVATDEMLEVARIPTCTMPHGSRINSRGTKQYSACMMDDTLVEIDTRTFRVARHFLLSKGKEMGKDGAPDGTQSKQGISCSPTWAEPSANGAFVYVACNKSDEIVEVDTASWKVTRRLPAGSGVYNLAATRDGRLIATNKRGQSVSVFDLESGKELARIPTKRRVVHGAAVTSDDRYVFISVEGVGSEPGTVEVIDLGTLETAATVDVGEQAAGIAFWKTVER